MYESIDELPDTIQDVLPPEAQKTYLDTFNESWESYEEEHTSELSQEAYANRDAWTAVKREFTKDEETGQWHPAGEVPRQEEEEKE
jgi:cation transport regulator